MTPWERYKEQHLFSPGSGSSGRTRAPRNKAPLRGSGGQTGINNAKQAPAEQKADASSAISSVRKPHKPPLRGSGGQTGINNVQQAPAEQKADASSAVSSGRKPHKPPLRGKEGQVRINDAQASQAIVKEESLLPASGAGNARLVTDAGSGSASTANTAPIGRRNRLPLRGNESQARIHDGPAEDRLSAPNGERGYSPRAAVNPWTVYKQRNDISEEAPTSVPTESGTRPNRWPGLNGISNYDLIDQLQQQQAQDPYITAAFTERDQKEDYLNASAIKPPAADAGRISASEGELYGLAYIALNVQSSYWSASGLADEMAQFQHGEPMTEEEIKSYGTRVGLLRQDAQYSLSWLEENKNRIGSEEYTDLKQYYEVQAAQAEQLAGVIEWYKNGGSAKLYVKIPEIQKAIEEGNIPLAGLSARISSLQGAIDDIDEQMLALDDEIEQLEKEQERTKSGTGEYGYDAEADISALERQKEGLEAQKEALQENYDLAFEEYSVYWGSIFAYMDEDVNYDEKVKNGRERYREAEAAYRAEVAPDSMADYIAIGLTGDSPQNADGSLNQSYFSANDYLTEQRVFARGHNPIYIELSSFTQEEQDTYYYLLGIGQDDIAIEYINTVAVQNRKADLQSIQNWAGTNTGTRMLASVASIAMTMLSPSTGLGEAILPYQRKALTGLDESSYLGFGATKDALRGGTAQGLTEKGLFNTGVLSGTAELPLVGERGLGDFYSIGMSQADSVIAGALFGPTGASAVLGSAAFSSSFNDAISNGATYEQALMRGFTHGVAEVAFERISLGTLFGEALKSATGAIRLFAQAGIEMSEELATSVCNIATDEWIMGARSDYNRRVSVYLQNGMSNEQAAALAKKDIIQGLLWEALSALLSGGSASAAYSATNYLSNGSALNHANGTQFGSNVFETNMTGMQQNEIPVNYTGQYQTAGEGKPIPNYHTVQVAETQEQAQSKMRDNTAGQADLSLPQTGSINTVTQAQAGSQSQVNAQSQQIQGEARSQSTAQTQTNGQTQSDVQTQDNHPAQFAGKDLANGRATSIVKSFKPGVEYYRETGRISEKAAREAGAVLDRIRNGEVSWKDLSNTDIAKLKLTTSQGAKAASLALGIPISKALTATDARSLIRSAVMKFEMQSMGSGRISSTGRNGVVLGTAQATIKAKTDNISEKHEEAIASTEKKGYNQHKQGYGKSKLRFMSNRDQFYKNLDKVPPLKGYIDIACHADPYTFGFVDPKTGDTVQEADAKALAKLVRESGKYKGGAIRLIACESGKLKNGLAQQFANEMGVPVLAPTKPAQTDAIGNLVSAYDFELAQKIHDAYRKWNPEDWVLFEPKEAQE